MADDPHLRADAKGEAHSDVKPGLYGASGKMFDGQKARRPFVSGRQRPVIVNSLAGCTTINEAFQLDIRLAASWKR